MEMAKYGDNNGKNNVPYVHAKTIFGMGENIIYSIGATLAYQFISIYLYLAYQSFYFI